MKRLLAFLFALVAGPALAVVPSVDQATSHCRAVAAAVSCTFSTTPAVGKTIIVVASGKNGDFGAAAPTDNQATGGNTYVKDYNFTEPGFGTWWTAIYRSSAISKASGTFTITLARNGADELNIAAVEVNNLTSTPLDKTVSMASSHFGDATHSDTITTTGTLTQADELVFTLAGGRYTTSPTAALATFPAPSGFTGIGSAYLGDGTVGNSPSHFAYKVVSATTAVQPVWTETVTQNNTQPGAASMMTVTYKAGAPSPSITSISSSPWRNGATITLGGSNLKSTGNSTITMGSVSQTVTTQSTTAPAFTADRGTNKYGTTLNIVLTDSDSVASNTYTGMTGLSPQSGWSYIDLTTPNATSSYRLTSSGDLVSGDQVAYDNKSGLVTVYSDGTWSADPSVKSFTFEVWSSNGGGWGTTATQQVNAAVKHKRNGAVVIF